MIPRAKPPERAEKTFHWQYANIYAKNPINNRWDTVHHVRYKTNRVSKFQISIFTKVYPAPSPTGTPIQTANPSKVKVPAIALTMPPPFSPQV